MVITHPNKKRNRRAGLQVLFGTKGEWRWRYDVNQLCYITPYIPRLQMTKTANLLYKKIILKPHILLWDMFGGIGTDSINFSNYFNVITTELDPNICDLLQQNVRTHGNCNLHAIHANCIQLLSIIKPDIVYFDPPWGEHYKPELKNFDFHQVRIQLFPELPNFENDVLRDATDIKATDLIKYIFNNVTSNIIVKCPINSKTFEELFPNNIIYTYTYRRKNLKFLYIAKNTDDMDMDNMDNSE